MKIFFSKHDTSKWYFNSMFLFLSPWWHEEHCQLFKVTQVIQGQTGSMLSCVSSIYHWLVLPPPPSPTNTCTSQSGGPGLHRTLTNIMITVLSLPVSQGIPVHNQDDLYTWVSCPLMPYGSFHKQCFLSLWCQNCHILN